MILVSGLYVYPVKSCRGISLEAAELAERGIRHDREWMVVDADGSFMTQREWPALARVEPRFEGEYRSGEMGEQLRRTLSAGRRS